MKRPIRAFAAIGLFIAGTTAIIGAAAPAQADVRICEQYGSTTIQGRYVVQNNRWGSNAEQCINVTSTGFSIVSQQGSAATNGAPLSYPSVFFGCHYTNCSPGTNLPLQVSQISSIPTNINYTYASGTYNASFDIWLDPTPKRDGVNQMEIMIWFNRQGPIQPIGSSVGNGTVAGRTWDVWRGSNGSNNVISYLAPSPINSWSFNVLDFVNDARNRGTINNSWYLTSIQAGFEPWNGSVGNGVNSFSTTVNQGTPPTSVPPTSPPPGGGGACRVAYTANSWNNGFTGNVTVTNTSSSTVNGWTLGFSFPSGQQITNSWNAGVTQSGSSVTARNVSYNSTIAPGASASFGFQGTHGGTNGAPTGWTLNGTACSS